MSIKGYHKAVTVQLESPLYAAIRYLAHSNKVTITAYVRSIIVDAVADEGLNVEYRREEGCPPGRESREASRSPTQ